MDTTRMITRKPTKQEAERMDAMLEQSMKSTIPESAEYKTVRYGTAVVFDPEPGESLDDAQRAAHDWITGR